MMHLNYNINYYIIQYSTFYFFIQTIPYFSGKCFIIYIRISYSISKNNVTNKYDKSTKNKIIELNYMK